MKNGYQQQSPAPDPLPKLLTIAVILSLSSFGLVTLARSYHPAESPQTAFQPNNLPQTPLTLAPQQDKGSGVSVSYRKISGEALYLTSIDLSDPQVYLGIGLAHNAPQANSNRSTRGDEHFTPMVRRHHAAITASGTFFSMDHQKRVMGNLVSGGKRLKYSPWDSKQATAPKCAPPASKAAPTGTSTASPSQRDRACSRMANPKSSPNPKASPIAA
jgi:hypothetical protein